MQVTSASPLLATDRAEVSTSLDRTQVQNLPILDRNARNPFSEPNGPPPVRFNQFGGALSGPISKNKFFFFGDYHGTRRRIGASLLRTTPAAAMRAGDFSALGTAIYDPATGNPDGSGPTQFADPSRATAGNPRGLNIIPQNRCRSASASTTCPRVRNMLMWIPGISRSSACWVRTRR